MEGSFQKVTPFSVKGNPKRLFLPIVILYECEPVKVLTKRRKKPYRLTLTLDRNNIPVLYTVKMLNKLCQSGNKIFGLLARGLPTTVNTNTIEIGNLKGKYGETIVGSMLNLLALEHNDLYVFHSVANPIGETGETDHLLLYKNKLILVETKTYNGFKSFKINKQGELRGKKINQPKSLKKLNNNNLIQKVDMYTKLLPKGYTVHAITAVTRSGVETYSENGKYKVSSLETLINNITYHIGNALDVTMEDSMDTRKLLASYCLKKTG